jgi:hypothetical protein
MTIRDKFRIALAVFALTVFGISALPADLVPEVEVPIAGIAALPVD